jgi:hypothetical protein
MMPATKLTRTALLALVLADAALLAGRAWAAIQLHASRAPFSRALRQAPLPSGFLSDGGAYDPPAWFRCALVQYTSSHCEYCRDQIPVAGRLAATLGGKGCVLVVVAPSPVEMPLLAAVPHQDQIAFVRPGWLTTVPHLQFEPTTWILGPKGNVVWYQAGELTTHSLRQAVAEVTAALNRR